MNSKNALYRRILHQIRGKYIIYYCVNAELVLGIFLATIWMSTCMCIMISTKIFNVKLKVVQLFSDNVNVLVSKWLQE